MADQRNDNGNGAGAGPNAQIANQHASASNINNFSDKEDYEGVHTSKKKLMPAVPTVAKPTTIEDFETLSKLGI